MHTLVLMHSHTCVWLSLLHASCSVSTAAVILLSIVTIQFQILESCKCLSKNSVNRERGSG